MSKRRPRAIPTTEGPMCKGGINPPNTSDARPPDPQGSGGNRSRSKAPTPPPSETGKAVKRPESPPPPKPAPSVKREASLSVGGDAIAITKIEAAYLITVVESFVRQEPVSLCRATMKSLLPRLGFLVGHEDTLKMLHCDTHFVQYPERNPDERD